MRKLAVYSLALALGAGLARAAQESEAPTLKEMSPKQVQKYFSKVVEEHVNASSAKTDGAFVIKDDVLKKDWALKLKKIHTQKIVDLGHDKYFACADFKEAKGKTTVDLDFYVGRSGNAWSVEKVLLHKVAGKPRFTYNDKNEMIPVTN